MVGYRGIVSIIEIIFYTPAAFLALFLALRHGFGRNAGWLFLIIFSLVRIGGASATLAAESNPSTGAFTAAAILSSVGLSPLLLATSGLLSRVNRGIGDRSNGAIPSIAFRGAQLLMTVAVILCVVGGVQASNQGSFKVQDITKVGVILFIVAYVAVAGFTAVLLMYYSQLSRDQKRILIAVTLALPFILVRFIYAILYALANKPQYNYVSGSVTDLLCIALIEEFIVTAIYIGTGLTLSKEPKPKQQPMAPTSGGSDQPIMPTSMRGSDAETPAPAPRSGKNRWRYGLIGGIVSYIVDASKNRQGGVDGQHSSTVKNDARRVDVEMGNMHR